MILCSFKVSVSCEVFLFINQRLRAAQGIIVERRPIEVQSALNSKVNVVS